MQKVIAEHIVYLFGPFVIWQKPQTTYSEVQRSLSINFRVSRSLQNMTGGGGKF